MARIPGSQPEACTQVGIGGFWSVLKLSLSTAALAMWLHPPLKWLVLIVGGLMLAETSLFVVTGATDLAVQLVVVVIVAILAGVIAIAIQALWRLRDPNRLVLVAPDLGASIDVIFKSRKRVTPANHGRAIRATSAPALRESVAVWLNGLEGYELDLRAQNMSVADHYMEQFPQLRVVGKDWMGHIRLASSLDDVDGQA